LLSVGDAIATARVEQVAVSADERELSRVFSEHKRTFTELPLDQKID
jgi:hypothetical protein